MRAAGAVVLDGSRPTSDLVSRIHDEVSRLRRPTFSARGVEDQLGGGAGVGDGDGVRRAWDLDGAVRVGALGHVVLERPGDVAVLLAEDEPRRDLLPQRAVAGRLEQRLRGRPPRRRHPCGLRLREVRAELLVEALRDDRQVGRAVAARDRLQRGAEVLPGKRIERSKARLPGVQREGGDVDEPGDVAGAGVDVRDDGAGVGVADEHDRALDRADDVGDAAASARDAAQRVGDAATGGRRSSSGSMTRPSWRTRRRRPRRARSWGARAFPFGRDGRSSARPTAPPVCDSHWATRDWTRDLP